MNDKKKEEKSLTSGYRKRKNKEIAKEKLEKQLQKIPRLTSFFQTASTSNKNEIVPENTNTIENSEIEKSNISNTAIVKPVAAENTSPHLSEIICEEHPSDFANFKDVLTVEEKNFILSVGPCRPQGPFPKDEKNRSFSKNYYKSVTKSGISIENTWLCYSPNKNLVYCQPCWLFSSERKNSGWVEGINDWQGLSKKIKKHENSDAHLNSCLILKQWKDKKTIDTMLLEDIEKEQSFWAKVLERLIKITLKLVKNCNSFRAHNESFSDIYNGNFLSDVQLLAEYDYVLKEVISLPRGYVRYLSPQIQNEIICLLSKNLERKIISDINSAPFFSIIVDTTQDLSKIDQLSFSFRFVKIYYNTNGSPISVKIEEKFLGFFKVDNQSANAISNQIIDILKIFGLDLKKCRGQGYDGASNMSGIYSGVQSRLKEIEKNATYIHCAAHNLNLVINDAMNGVPEIRNFFSNIQEIYTFFGLSINRWDLLSKITGESEVTLKKLNPTRWAGRLSSCIAIKCRYIDVMKALSKIILESKKKDEITQAMALRNKMDCLDFIFVLVLVIEILSPLNLVSKLLQSKNIDLDKVSSLLDNGLKEIKPLRNNFDEILAKAKSLASKWNILPTFKQKRMKKTKKMFDELSIDYQLETTEQQFKVNVFYMVIDIVTNQIDSRFTSLRTVNSYFSFLNPKNLMLLDSDEVFKQAMNLLDKYPMDIGNTFANQMVLFQNTFKADIKNLESTADLLKLLTITYCDISSSFTEVITALMLFLTLPVSVATAERSFSTLKRIKTHLRTTMTQDRLSALSLLAIEAEEAAQLNLRDVIDQFAAMKARKKQFY